MRTIFKQWLLIIVATATSTVAMTGCLDDKEAETPNVLTDQQKIDTWKMGDWLHDIDSANRVMEAARNGDYGAPTKEKVAKLDLPRRAIKVASAGALNTEKCWPRFELGNPNTQNQIDTDHTDHACLDAAGHKRSK
jgi:hypothetical protein